MNSRPFLFVVTFLLGLLIGVLGYRAVTDYLAAIAVPVQNMPTATTTATTITEQIASTTTQEIAGACLVKPDTGTCKASITRYYFNKLTGTCESFTWGGCKGSVPFVTKAACQQACEK